jgi:hypothetical protein
MPDDGQNLISRAASEKKAQSFSERSTKVRFWPSLCENAKTLNRERRSYSSKTVLAAQRASGFNLEIELKNIILHRVSIFEFSHSLGHQRTLSGARDKAIAR